MNKDKFKEMADAVQICAKTRCANMGQDKYSDVASNAADFLSSIADLGEQEPDDRQDQYDSHDQPFVTKENRDYWQKLAIEAIAQRDANAQKAADEITKLEQRVKENDRAFQKLSAHIDNPALYATEKKSLEMVLVEEAITRIERGRDADRLNSELDKAKRRIAYQERVIQAMVQPDEPKQPLLTPEQWEAMLDVIKAFSLAACGAPFDSKSAFAAKKLLTGDS